MCSEFGSSSNSKVSCGNHELYGSRVRTAKIKTRAILIYKAMVSQAVIPISIIACDTIDMFLKIFDTNQLKFFIYLKMVETNRYQNHE
jgi:hypothetical protein